MEICNIFKKNCYFFKLLILNLKFVVVEFNSNNMEKSSMIILWKLLKYRILKNHIYNGKRLR